MEAEFSNLDGWNEVMESIQDLLVVMHQRVITNEPQSEFEMTTSHGGGRGRPKYNITEEQLTLLTEIGFTSRAMSLLLHVSEATIHRRLRVQREFPAMLKIYKRVLESNRNMHYKQYKTYHKKEMIYYDQLFSQTIIIVSLKSKMLYLTHMIDVMQHPINESMMSRIHWDFPANLKTLHRI
jgi:hypothetical protein